MSFIVHARAADREITSQHASMLSALKRAFILVGSGLTGVAISDRLGRQYSPTEVSRKLLGADREAIDAADRTAGRIAA